MHLQLTDRFVLCLNILPKCINFVELLFVLCGDRIKLGLQLFYRYRVVCRLRFRVVQLLLLIDQLVLLHNLYLRFSLAQCDLELVVFLPQARDLRGISLPRGFKRLSGF